MSAGGRDQLKAACITVLGSGCAPFASGSWGSLVALLLFAGLWWGVQWLVGGRCLIEGLTLAGILLSSLLCVRWGAWALARYGGRDPSEFTLDEFAGQWVALLALPISVDAGLPTFSCVVGGQFFLFRLFDVLKLPPARQAEGLPAGWGVLCDDLIAGAQALLVGQLIWRLTPLAAWLDLSGVRVHDVGA